MFKKRLGPDPHLDPGNTPSRGAKGCPDIWELDNGDFAVIGLDHTGILSDSLPASASCGPDERIVILPRSVLVAAKRDIPEN